MKLSRILFFLSVGIVSQACSQHTNWDQYLGPNRNATVNGKEILRSWGEEGPKKLWSINVGEGYGGAAIFDNEVFFLDREKGSSDILRCIDLNSGEEIWSYSYTAEGELSFPGSRAVPTVNKDHVWTVGPHGDFYCFDKNTRKPLWNLNLKERYDTELTQWGYSQSPILFGDMIIVAPHGKKAGVVAYNKASGDIIWESRTLTGHSYHSSPTLANFGGIDQVIMISPYDRKDSTKIQEVVSFDANTGDELWKYEGLRSFSTISPPSVVGEERLFLTDCSYNGNYGPVSILLEITLENDEFKIEEIFFTEEAGCKMHPGVLFENHFYLNSTGRPNMMQCLDMNGKAVWEADSIPGFDLGGLIMINDLIINQNGKNGDIYLIEPSADGYIELGKASFFNSDKSQAWAPPAYSQGKLIVRDMEQMVCVNLMELE